MNTHYFVFSCLFRSVLRAERSIHDKVSPKHVFSQPVEKIVEPVQSVDLETQQALDKLLSGLLYFSLNE